MRVGDYKKQLIQVNDEVEQHFVGVLNRIINKKKRSLIRRNNNHDFVVLVDEEAKIKKKKISFRK